MRARRDPILLLRFALREGDHRLADLLLARFRGDARLTARADFELVRVPRARTVGPGLAEGPGGA